MRSGHTWHLVFALLLLLPAIAFAEASDTKSEEESRGQHRVGLGLMGLAVPGVDLYAGGGFLLRWTYEKGPLALLGDLRAAYSADGKGFLGGFGLGSRWSPLEGGVSPFLGAGLQGILLSVNDRFEGRIYTLGAWAELGVALRRDTDRRLTFEVRVEPPFSKVRTRRRFLEGGLFSRPRPPKPPITSPSRWA